MWWEQYLTPSRWAAFVQQLTAYFEAKHLPIHLEADSSFQIGGNKMGLLNVVQKCALAEPAEWGQIISEHFDNLFTATDEFEKVSEQAKDYVLATSLLAVRLWPRNYADSLGYDKLVYRTDLEDTVSVLVFDLPTSIRNITPGDVAGWQRPVEELFRVALSNTLENNPPEVQEQALPDDLKVWVFLGDNFYVASQALLLEHFPQCLGTHGAIVGIPRRHTLICYPINSLEVLKALNYLPIIIHAMDKEGPGSITPNVYWYTRGRFVKLPYELSETAYSLTPPEEFLEMLNEMAGPEEEGDG